MFKRMDACHYFTFHGFELEDGSSVLTPHKMPGRRIEVFSDSVSCFSITHSFLFIWCPSLQAGKHCSEQLTVDMMHLFSMAEL